MTVEIKLAVYPPGESQAQRPKGFVPPDKFISLVKSGKAAPLDRELAASSDVLTILNHRAGLNQAQMGAVFDRSQAVISQLCRNAGVRTRWKRILGVRSELVPKYDELGSLTKMRRDTGRSREWLKQELTSMGVHVLSREEQMKRKIRRKVTPRMINLAISLYGRQMSVREVAAELNRRGHDISRETVRLILKEAGEVRSREEGLDMYFHPERYEGFCVN